MPRAGQSPEDGLAWYTLGEEIPLATLVSATVEIPAGGAVYFRYGAACIDLTGNVGTVDVFELGAEMPPDAFAPVATSDHYQAR